MTSVLARVIIAYSCNFSISQLNGTSSIPGTAVLEIDITDMSLNGGTPNSVSYASSSPFLTPDEADIHTDSLARNIDHATCCQCDCLIEKLNWVKNDSVDSFELLKKAELSDMVDKLLGDVSFGYGLFHLCMSILSPQIVRVIQFLGFSSDRRLGLKCLQFASGKSTMKGPLATYVSSHVDFLHSNTSFSLVVL